MEKPEQINYDVLWLLMYLQSLDCITINQFNKIIDALPIHIKVPLLRDVFTPGIGTVLCYSNPRFRIRGINYTNFTFFQFHISLCNRIGIITIHQRYVIREEILKILM